MLGHGTWRHACAHLDDAWRPATVPRDGRLEQLNPIIEFLQKVVTLNNSFTWAYVWKYLFFAAVIQGVVLTVIISVISQFFGTLLGLFLYYIRRSNARVLR